MTDPPYELGFMGKGWDSTGIANNPALWAEVLRVLKPGGHVAAFSGTRTYHRMACAIEDAGFEVRDQLAWCYGTGFPKSHDVSKGIDKLRDWTLVERLAGEISRARAESGLSLKKIGEATLAATNGQYGAWYHRGGHMFFETGRSLPSRPEWDRLRLVLPIADEFASVYDAAEREVLNRVNYSRSGDGSWAANIDGGMFKSGDRTHDITAPATDAARQWQGWGTALKPAWEPICLARKPLSEKTVAANVLRWGTGAINVDGCRVEGVVNSASGALQGYGGSSTGLYEKGTGRGALREGRFPANLCHDGSDEVLAEFPESKSTGGKGEASQDFTSKNGIYGQFGKRQRANAGGLGDSGSAARFFYCAKASKHDRITRLVEDVRIEWISELGQRLVTLQVDTERLHEKAIVVSEFDTSSEWSMFLYGRSIADLFRTATKCTTGTVTSSTTELKTWSLLMTLLTSEFTGDASCEPASGGSPAENAESSSPSMTITVGPMGFRLGASHVPSGTPLTISVSARRHSHPTTKPVKLMQWLVRLITPPGGTALDPFAGTGTTGEAAWREGFSAILIEREAEYQADIERRLTSLSGSELPLFSDEKEPA